MSVPICDASGKKILPQLNMDKTNIGWLRPLGHLTNNVTYTWPTLGTLRRFLISSQKQLLAMAIPAIL